jgi:hypothetical protein
MRRSLSKGILQSRRRDTLLDHLQFFADYENWTAGDPLPNRYSANSGISSLADNNGVREETGAPLVGSKSGLYRRQDNESHTSTSQTWPVSSKDFYFACFVSKIIDSFQVHLSVTDAGGDTGVDLATTNTTSPPELRLATESAANGRSQIGAPISNGTHFCEGWYTHSDGMGHLRVDNGPVVTSSLPPPDDSTIPFAIGRIAQYTSTDLRPQQMFDMVAFELAPVGELRWPSEGSFLYNGGDGRRWDEIQLRAEGQVGVLQDESGFPISTQSGAQITL